MSYVLAIAVMTLYIYFRFGKKALALALAVFGILALARGFVAITIPLLIIAYFLVKNEKGFPKLGRFGSGSKKAVNHDKGPRQPTISSRFLYLYLDAATGDLTGQTRTGRRGVGIRPGPFPEQKLIDLDEAKLKQLKQHYEKSDKESAALLYAYLDNNFPEWREDPETKTNAAIESASSAHRLSRAEAFAILGLNRPTNLAAVKQAHRTLMKQYHPDQGGAAIIAAKLNMAKDQLLDKN